MLHPIIHLHDFLNILINSLKEIYKIPKQCWTDKIATNFPVFCRSNSEIYVGAAIVEAPYSIPPINLKTANNWVICGRTNAEIKNKIQSIIKCSSFPILLVGIPPNIAPSTVL
jgi:hypothetical protein